MSFLNKMKNLIEVSDSALKNLDKLNISYNIIKKDKTSREEISKISGFNPEEIVYCEASGLKNIYFLKNPQWPVQTFPVY